MNRIRTNIFQIRFNYLIYTVIGIIVFNVPVAAQPSLPQVHISTLQGSTVDGHSAVFTWDVLPNDYVYSVAMFVFPGNPGDHLCPVVNSAGQHLCFADGLRNSNSSTYLNNTITVDNLPGDGNTVVFRLTRMRVYPNASVAEEYSFTSGPPLGSVVHIPTNEGMTINGDTAIFTWDVLPDDYTYYIQIYYPPDVPDPFLFPYYLKNSESIQAGWPDGYSQRSPGTYLNNTFTFEYLPDDGSEARVRLHRIQASGTSYTGTSYTVEEASFFSGITPGNTIIDLLVLYTPSALIRMNLDKDLLDAKIRTDVLETNIAYERSGVNQQLRLVHIAETDYFEFDANLDLNRLIIDSGGTGYMDDAHILRDQYSADLVVLYRESTGFSGLAFTMQNPSTTFDDLALSLVSINDPAPYLLAKFTGHNMGLELDEDSAFLEGAYPYSFGYRDEVNLFRTIMAEPCDLPIICPKIQNFSNPGVFYNGAPTGTANANNALTLNNTASIVASFRNSGGNNVPPSARFDASKRFATATPVTITFDATRSFDADGYIDDYSWDFGDGSPVVSGKQPKVDHTFNADGDYVVTLTVTDDQGATSTGTAKLGLGPVVIDVMAAYNEAALDYVGGEENLDNEITLAIAKANLAFERSDVRNRFQLVHIGAISYTDPVGATDYRDELDFMSTIGDGKLEAVSGLRNQYEADLVVGLFGPRTEAGASGYAMGETWVHPGFAPIAYCAMDPRWTAFGYYLPRFFGYLMGAGTEPPYDFLDESGAFPYATGYRDTVNDFRTIMTNYDHGLAAPCPMEPCLYLANWSSPIIFYNGFPTGFADQNNSLALNQTVNVVSAFRNQGSNIFPTARIYVIKTGSAGSPVDFDGSGSFDVDGPIDNYQWDFGDGTPVVSGANESEVSHTFAANGKYTVTLTVTDDQGASHSFSIDITIGITMVDVLVVYTDAAKQFVGSEEALDTGIKDTFELLNRIYDNSEVRIHARIAHIVEAAYTDTDTTTSSNDLAVLQNTTDGILDGVHAIRDQYKADIITLIHKTNPSDMGFGYLMSDAFFNPGWDIWAMNVLEAEAINTVGTFPFIIGNNMGANLEDANDYPQYPPIFNYAHGYRDSVNGWRTIMTSYESENAVPCLIEPCPYIEHYSNPDVLYNGFPTGTADANNALTLNQTVTLISSLRISNGADIPPTARIYSADSASASTEITFSGQGSFDPDGSLTFYEWDMGDGTLLDGPIRDSVQHTYGSSGNYTVRLTVTDDQGMTHFIEKTVNITP